MPSGQITRHEQESGRYVRLVATASRRRRQGGREKVADSGEIGGGPAHNAVTPG
jgi:hypothetical protein